jgi:RimJ/RimL family protein N-acetyltransferase
VELIFNLPLDTAPLEKLFDNPEDLFLLWPLARWPFDRDQWRETLDPAKGILPFLVLEGERLIGHAALDATEDPATRMARFLYVIPEFRGRGTGQKLLALLERYALETFRAKRLTLRVRSYNARAIRCYEKSGFSEYSREDTLITMEKRI